MDLKEYIEHTLLKQDATKEDLEKLLNEAKTHHFKGVCVNGYNIKAAKEYLKDDVVLMHGDLVFDKTVLQDFLNPPRFIDSIKLLHFRRPRICKTIPLYSSFYVWLVN